MTGTAQETGPIALRQNPNPYVRRSARVVAMLGELHKAGFQLLRAMPYMSPSGIHWRFEIGPAALFHHDHGAMMVSASDLIDSSDRDLNAVAREIARYSTGQADGGNFFSWGDAKQDGARELADKLLRRFPVLAEHGRGWDYAYAGWYQRFQGLVEHGFFPYCFADMQGPSRRGLHISSMRPPEWGPPLESPELPLPPPGLLMAPISFDEV